MTQNYFQVNGNCFKQYEGTVTFDGDGDGQENCPSKTSCTSMNDMIC